MLWHEAILPLLWHHRQQKIAIIVSQGREGQYLGDYASQLGYQLLQGSSSRGGARAMLGAVRALREGFPVAITPDGPRGPARALKPGVIQAAQRGGAVVVPLHAMVDRAWRLGSWDRLVIPKPWARVVVGYGSPFEIGDGQAGVDEGVQRCEAAMLQLESEMRPL